MPQSDTAIPTMAQTAIDEACGDWGVTYDTLAKYAVMYFVCNVNPWWSGDERTALQNGMSALRDVYPALNHKRQGTRKQLFRLDRD